MKLKLLQGSMLFVAAFFNQSELFAQMYVSPNSYMFVKNEQVFVKGDVELNDATSNIYLRNEGQLLQGTTGVGANKGVGSLSVFQEGTSNNFGYNYWCSPVGVPAAAAGNNPFGVGQLKRPTGLTTFGGESLTTGLDGSSTNSSLTIASRWVYKFLQSNQYASWVSVGAANTINAGEGFTMKGVSGTDNTDVGEATVNNPGNNQRYDFRGKPNDGTINISVGNLAATDPNQTLTGNPYPSAINLNLFLLENSGYTVNYTTGDVTGPLGGVIDGRAYFWEHRKPATSHMLNQYIGGYGSYAPNNTNAFSPGTYSPARWNTYNPDGTLNTTGVLSATIYKRMFCPIGQGFMVRGSVPSGTAQMKNIYRVFVKEGIATNSQFERINNETTTQNWDEIPNVAGVDYTKFSKLETPQIKIHTVLNNQYTRETVIAFNPNTTDGYDVAMDAIAPDAKFPNDVYFPVVTNEQYVITTLPFDANKKIPFAFKMEEQTTFKVTVSNIINFIEADNVYLHDKQTGIYYDIKNNFFEITLPAGVVTDRFEITFKDNTLSTNDTTLADSLMVFQNNDTKNLTISNPQLLDLTACTLYDVAGKLIFSKNKLGTETEYTFPTANLSDGVYIVRLNTKDNKQIGKKIIVKH